MSDFYSKLSQTQDNVSVTENGMAGYKTTNHSLVDFNFKVSSYRTNTAASETDFTKVLNEKEAYVLKYLMYLRDVREGIGERDLFRSCLKKLATSSIEDLDSIMDRMITTWIPEYGRFDDLFVLMGTKYEAKVVAFIKKQLAEDYKNYRENKSISLLAKWMPSENASARETVALARTLTKALKTSPKVYRKTLSTLRAYLDVIEVKTCANEWDKVDYNAVPSKANLKYKNAFLAHDEERRRTFLSKAIAGDKEVKVHMAVSFPHEIVHQYTGGSCRASSYDQSLEAYWKNLKPCVGLKDTIVVRDGSGSMTTRVGGTSVSAMDVSTALAIYCSQYLEGSFKDKFITFSSEAQLVDLSGSGSLKTKLDKTYSHGDCSNTDIQNVFELILDTARENQMKQEEIPSTVLIISDMEFDPSHNSGGWWGGGMHADSNVFKVMDAKFKAAGYKLPKLAFWNVISRTCTIPCKYNENGVLLISGFSQNVLSMVMNGKTDPYDALVTELSKARYESIPLVSYGTPVVQTTGTGRKPTRKESKKEISKSSVPEFLK